MIVKPIHGYLSVFSRTLLFNHVTWLKIYGAFAPQFQCSFLLHLANKWTLTAQMKAAKQQHLLFCLYYFSMQLYKLGCKQSLTVLEVNATPLSN